MDRLVRASKNLPLTVSITAYLLHKFDTGRSPTQKTMGYKIVSQKTDRKNVLNLRARAAAPSQKHISGWVLSSTWNDDSNISLTFPPIFTKGREGIKK